MGARPKNSAATVLVTGCAGFIGYHLCHRLLQDGCNVVGIDDCNGYYDRRLKRYRLEKLQDHRGNDSGHWHFVETDICDLQKLEKVFSQFPIETIYSLAARAGVRHNEEEREQYFHSNLEGTRCLLDSASRFRINSFVMASTSSLYGGHPTPFVESHEARPQVSSYAESKYSAEALAEKFSHTESANVSILRYFSVYGPAGRPDMSYFRFIDQIYQGKTITVFGDGSQARDFTHVDDIVRGTLAAANASHAFEVFNLGSGRQPISVNELIQKIEIRLGKRAQVDHQPQHPADLQTTQADRTKAEKLLGWIPQVEFDDGLEQCIEWYLANQSFVASLQQ